MKKYGTIWLLLFFSVIFMLSNHCILYNLISLYDTDNLITFGISLILSTQITGFLYLARKIKDLPQGQEPTEE